MTEEQKGARVFVMLHWFWNNWFLHIFDKIELFWIKLSFKNRELRTITINADTLSYSSISWNSGNMTTYDFYLFCFQLTIKILQTLFL